MHEKNFTVAFFRFAASIITHIRVQVNIRHYLEKKGGKLTLVDLQLKKKTNKLRYKYSVPGVLMRSALNY